jgi:hypothetical protein
MVYVYVFVQLRAVGRLVMMYRELVCARTNLDNSEQLSAMRLIR